MNHQDLSWDSFPHPPLTVQIYSRSKGTESVLKKGAKPNSHAMNSTAAVNTKGVNSNGKGGGGGGGFSKNTKIKKKNLKNLKKNC